MLLCIDTGNRCIHLYETQTLQPLIGKNQFIAPCYKVLISTAAQASLLPLGLKTPNSSHVPDGYWVDQNIYGNMSNLKLNALSQKMYYPYKQNGIYKRLLLHRWNTSNTHPKETCTHKFAVQWTNAVHFSLLTSKAQFLNDFQHPW